MRERRPNPCAASNNFSGAGYNFLGLFRWVLSPTRATDAICALSSIADFDALLPLTSRLLGTSDSCDVSPHCGIWPLTATLVRNRRKVGSRFVASPVIVE
jgi:hypothetical protein